MATEILYNYDPITPAQISREEYSDVGSSAFQLGDAARGFKGGTDLEIWDSEIGGTQLIENTDYEILDIDSRLSPNAGFDIYTRVRILNATYQTGDIYITYKVVLSYVDAVFYNNLYNVAIAAGGTSIKYLTNAESPFTITDGDGFGKFVCDTSGGDIIINDPTLADNQNRELEFIHQVGGGLVSVVGEGAESMGGLNIIELPKQGDRLSLLGTTAEWAITEESISCQIRLNTFSGYGSTDNKIMQFANAVENYGNIFTNNFGAYGVNGLEIVIAKNGKYSFTYSCRQPASPATENMAFSLNSSQLTTVVSGINVSDRLPMGDIQSGTVVQAIAWSGVLSAGDIIRPHTSGKTPNVVSHVFFSATYMGG